MEGEMTLTSVTQFIIAAGAVGTAAMGIVEGAKSVHIKPLGFRSLMSELQWAIEALKVAYGEQYDRLLKSLYRLNRSEGELPRILRQGVRIGLNKNNAALMAETVLGDVDGSLPQVATKIAAGESLSDQEKNILGRFEVAVDARIDAALALADRAYGNGIRLCSFIVAIFLSLMAAQVLHFTGGYKTALIVGLISVPLAPIAKDVAKGLQSAANAIAAKAK